MYSKSAAVLAITLAVVASPALTGCSAHDIVRDATGGNVDVGGKTVPKDFPTEIPLAKGEIIFAAAVGAGTGKVWNLSIRVDNVDAIDGIQTQLTGAGFDVNVLTPKTEDGGSLTATNGTRAVAVVEVKDDKGFIVNYSVTPAPKK